MPEGTTPERRKPTSDERRERARKRRRWLQIILLLLLLIYIIELGIFGAPTASVIIELPLSEDARKLIGDDVYESPTAPAQPTKPALQQPPKSGFSVQGEEPVPVSNGGAERIPGQETDGGDAARGEGANAEPPGGRAPAESVGAGQQSGNQEPAATGGGARGEEGNADPAGGQGPDRRGGGGAGTGGGGGSGGGSGTGGGGGGTPGSPPSAPTLSVMLRNSKGEVFMPRYRFAGGSAKLELNERRFTPGMYVLIITKTYSSGSSESVEQPFAWGVLAMNTDRDRYFAGEDAHVDIGVLDEDGAIVCDADLVLTVTDPAGGVAVLSTGDNSISITGTCGVKQAGFIEPDYETNLSMDMVGTYQLELIASGFGGGTHKLTSEVQVVETAPYIVSRRAATRLWPLAPSPMHIGVEFREDFSGTIADIVPEGFAIVSSSPAATYMTDEETEERLILWSGSWLAGETISLQYTYDAPDISPEFYLVGPLTFASAGGALSAELRSWQIANDDVAASTNYRIPSDVQAAGGGELALSSNYALSDTIGEPVVGLSSTANYRLNAGYRQTISSFLSIACTDNVDLGTIPGTGQGNGSATCTVITDAEAGYTLSWIVSTGSGGSNTGHMISQLEDVIQAYTPAGAGVPETWSVASNDARWGGRLSSTSTDTDAKWGVDSMSEKWLNVGTGSYTVVERQSRTGVGGSSEILQFRTEVGSSKLQTSGTYSATAVVTVTAN